MAAIGEMTQCPARNLDLGGLSLERRDVVKRQALDVRTGPRLVAPQSQQARDLIDREAEVACTSDKAQSVGVLLVILRISVDYTAAVWMRSFASQ